MTTDALEAARGSARPNANNPTASNPTSSLYAGVKRWLREPLVHFLGLGTLIFAFNAVIAPAVPPEKKIEFTSSTRQSLIDSFARAKGRSPTEQEIQQLSKDWLLNEITYREALAQGFDKGDDMIRDRVMQKMRLLIFSNVSVPNPTRAELQQWLDSHRDQFDVPKRVSFFEVPMESSEADTRAMLQLINTGKEPASVRLRAHTFQDRPVNSLIQAFGQPFLDRLQMLPARQWDMLQAPDGWHLVRLEEIIPARRVSVEEVRDPLSEDWKTEQARAKAVGTVREIGKNYVIGGIDRP
jgi:hypothetical protein